MRCRRLDPAELRTFAKAKIANFKVLKPVLRTLKRGARRAGQTLRRNVA